MFAKSLLTLATLGLGLAVQVAWANGANEACPTHSSLQVHRGKCVCKEHPHGGFVPFKQGCGATVKDFWGFEWCDPFCHHRPTHSQAAHHHQRRSEEIVMKPTESDHNASPCARPEIACPVFFSDASFKALKADDFECVDPLSDLDNCGGCTSLNLGESCADAPNVRTAACVKGKCQINSCKSGYKRVSSVSTYDGASYVECVPF